MSHQVFSPAHQQLRNSALRVTSGVLAAKLRDDFDGARVLVNDYFAGAQAGGICVHDAWLILFTASMHWTTDLIAQLARAEDTSTAEITSRMGYQAALWEGDHDESS